MSTRARIALAMANGKFKSVYVHMDGYPEGVGATLAQHYGTPAKVKTLLALGDLSRLDPALSPSSEQVHNFRNPLPGVTVAYGRDRGDKDCGAVTSINFTALAAASVECNAEYIYSFDDGKWSFAPVSMAIGAAFPTDAGMVEMPNRAPYDKTSNQGESNE